MWQLSMTMAQSCLCCGMLSRKQYLLFSGRHAHLVKTWEFVLQTAQRQTSQSLVDSHNSTEGRPGVCQSCFRILESLKKNIDLLAGRVLSSVSSMSSVSSVSHLSSRKRGNTDSIQQIRHPTTLTVSKRPRLSADSGSQLQHAESISHTQPVVRRLNMDQQQSLSPAVEES